MWGRRTAGEGRSASGLIPFKFFFIMSWKNLRGEEVDKKGRRTPHSCDVVYVCDFSKGAW